jgi:hypothetical protein
MESLCGHKQRFEGETVGKSGRIPVDSVCFERLKRELLEAVGRAQSEVESRVHEGVHHQN